MNNAAKKNGRTRPLAEINQKIGDTPIDSPTDIDDGTSVSPNKREDNPALVISDNGKYEKTNETSSPRRGKYNLRPNTQLY